LIAINSQNKRDGFGLTIFLKECLLVNGSDEVLEAIIKNIPFKVVGLENIKLEQKNGFGDKLSINLDLLCQGLSISPCIKSLSFKECIFNRQPIEAAQCLGRLVRTHPTLESITLGHTLYSDGLEYFFEGLKYNKTLKKLDATFINLNEASAYALSAALRVSTTLEDLNMEGVKFESFKALKHIVEAIGFNKSLKTLRISNIENREYDGDEEPARKKQKTGLDTSKRKDSNNEDPFEYTTLHYIEQKLLESLLRNNTLTKLRLSESEIFPIYGEVLEKNTTLTSLEFHDCAITSNLSAQAISEALKVNTILRSFAVADCADFVDDWNAVDFEALIVNSTLTELNVGSEMSEVTSQHFFEVLARNTTLRALDLSGGEFSLDQINQVKDYLSQNTTLTKLDFSGQYERGHFILEALQVNTALRSLDFGGNILDAESCVKLSTILQQNRTLQNLRLYDCEINDDGARSLAQGLRRNSTLTSLDIASNMIDIAGTSALCASLNYHPTLTKLVYTTNHCDIQGAFGSLLRTNTTLESLVFDGGPVNTEAMTHLCNALKVNTTLQSLQVSQYWDKINEIEVCRKLLIDALRVNESVTSYEGTYVRLVDGIEPFLAKNLKLRRDRLDNVLVLSHNIVRAHKRGRQIEFPIDVWTQILSYLSYPAIKFNFATMFQAIAKKYK
jgi:hypothetical protein